MKKIFILAISFLFAANIFAQEIYKSSYRPRSGIAHGGIGTGSIELRKDGQFYNWSIFNNYPRGTGPIFNIKSRPRTYDDFSTLFFLVRYQVEGEEARIKLLQLNNEINEGGQIGIAYYYPWMTAIEKVEYEAKFPNTKIKFTDSEMPFEIELTVNSPFIPHDVKNSSLPGVYFDFNVKSKSDKKVNIFLIATLRNLVGYDTIDKLFTASITEEKGYKYFDMSVDGMDTESPVWGQMGIASLSDESTYYLGWEHKHPYYELLVVNNKFPDINDTEGRNFIDEKTGKKVGRYTSESYDQRHFSSIGITKELEFNQSFKHSFVFTWNFPNAYGAHNAPTIQESVEWNNKEDYSVIQKVTKKIGNYYNNFFNTSLDVADYMVKNRDDLQNRTNSFFNDFYSSDLDQWFLEQISSNLNTFRTSSTFNKKGQFGIREGLSADKSWGPNITSDVTYYGSSSIITLFPSLQLSSMRAHKSVQQPNGDIAHGLAYDMDYTQNGTWGVSHRVDLVGNYIQMVVRDYLWTDDNEFIKEMWPSLKKAFDFGINQWDTNNDNMPDMHGIMSSYDNFPMNGLASYIQSQWLNSAKGMYEVAKVLNDSDEEKYKEIYEDAVKLMEEHIWNGEYYVLANDYTGDKGVDKGILTDQAIGQWMAHQSGFGSLLKPERVRLALNKILEVSYKPSFGLRNCTWPEYPELFPIHESGLWVDQANSCWTGVELAFASFLMYEDMYDEAMKVTKTVDDRYRKNGLYFDHQEFGGHYLRPMSAWGILNGALGLAIRNNNYIFSPCIPKDNYKVLFAYNNGTAFFSKKMDEVALEVRSGEMKINSISLPMEIIKAVKGICVDGKKQEFQLKGNVMRFNNTIIIEEGSTLTIK
ncbi:MAG: hypothetical protein JEY94_01205 [Melioribacteraceae bacterium]|nr:hypothetical protein [Melioribacteraceae bacterium]